MTLTTPNADALSALCFGTMQFGGNADAKSSEAMFQACRAAGVNFFDTAHVYTEGRSEEYLGRFVQKERDELIVATKAGYTGGSGRTNIQRQFDKSRQRLGLDCVDVLYLHRCDAQTPLEETFETLAELQQGGKIRYIGVSNFAAWQVMKAHCVAQRLGTKIDILQPMYSLVKRQAEVELFPMALAEGISVAGYSPLGSGLLTGKYLRGGQGRLSSDKRYAARYGQDWMHETARRFSDLATEQGHSPTTLAVTWAAHHPAVSCPIISARNTDQLGPSLDAASVQLDDALYREIAELTPPLAPATDRLEEAT